MSSPILVATTLQIVEGALRLIGEADANQQLDANQFQDGLQSINFMIKGLQAQGLHLWTKTEGILFLDVGRTDYRLGPNGDEATNIDEFVNTTLSVDALSGAVILILTSTVGMSVDDKIGIQLNDGTRQWTTILTIDSAVQLTITDMLTDDASTNNTVFTFTNLINRPIRLLQLRRFTIGQNDEIEAVQWYRQEYFDQTDKTSQGQVNNWYYSPQLNDGRIYIWQTASNVNQVAKFTYIRPIEINEETSESPDFPAEWVEPLVFLLAARIGPEYRITQARLDMLRQDAAVMLDNALGHDLELSSLNIQPVLGNF